MNETTGTTTEITTEHRCIRCKRVLTNKYSIKRGYGRGCQTHLREAARKLMKIYTRAQVQKAATALRNGTIRHITGDRYECDSSNGRDVYSVTPYTCDCPSRVRCYHRCAVMVRELTPLQRR